MNMILRNWWHKLLPLEWRKIWLFRCKTFLTTNHKKMSGEIFIFTFYFAIKVALERFPSLKLLFQLAQVFLHSMLYATRNTALKSLLYIVWSMVVGDIYVFFVLLLLKGKKEEKFFHCIKINCIVLSCWRFTITWTSAKEELVYKEIKHGELNPNDCKFTRP